MPSGGLQFSKFDLEDTTQFNQFELEANSSNAEMNQEEEDIKCLQVTRRQATSVAVHQEEEDFLPSVASHLMWSPLQMGSMAGNVRRRKRVSMSQTEA